MQTATPSAGRRTSLMVLGIAILVWSGAYPVTKVGVTHAPPMMVALLRYCVASVILVPLAIRKRGRFLVAEWIPTATHFWMALSGIALYYVAFNLGLFFTSSSQGALAQSAFPAVAAVMAAIWLHERIGAVRWIGIGLAVFGAALIVSHGASDANSPRPVLGNLLMAGSVVMWAAYTILAKRVAHVDPLPTTALVFVMGTLLLIPPALFEMARSGGSVQPIPGIAWAAITYLGAVASAGAYVLYGRALRDLDASEAATLLNLVTLVGALFGILFLHEHLTSFAAVGAGLVVAGVWLVIRR